MISLKSATFKFIDNGYKDLAVLVPGWATDYRIFGPLNLEFNYLVPLTFYPDTFEEDLLKTLRENNIDKLSLFGWSLGGFLAAEFASKHKELIDRLILVSIRKKYDKKRLTEIKTHLGKNKRGYLYKFYTQCFFKKESMRWFRKNFLKTYCEELDLHYLVDSLGYLQNAEIRPELLEPIKKIKIIHGECDRIAPIKEALWIKEKLPQAEFISIKNTGHIPFLEACEPFAISISTCPRKGDRLNGKSQTVQSDTPGGGAHTERHPLPAANDKEIIKRNFSRYAKYYDNYSDIQDVSALRLISKLDSDNFSSILDLGCGTGNYTRLLREKFPLAKIKAIDISGEMIEIARKKLQGKQIEFVIKDAEGINSRDSLDLISSNVSFQWFVNLEKALLDYKRLLKPGGTILFSTFGPLTFYELNNALQELLKEEKEINSRRFLEKIRITKIMEALFKKVEVGEETFKESYVSLRGLLEKIKYSGIRGSGIKTGNFWVFGKMDKLERIYKKKFNEIVATYQVFICKGIK